MLAAQAHAAASYFSGEAIPEARLEKALKALRAEVENIVLVGMPGSGKSSLGKLLAQKTGRGFVDTDARIEEKAGCDIPSIISEQGEAAFRDLEQEAVFEAASGHGLVIATGGGAILRGENRKALRQNGRVYFLERELSDLPKEGRPLSTDLSALYEKRLPLYRAAAHRQIDNNGSLEQSLAAILEDFYENSGDQRAQS